MNLTEEQLRLLSDIANWILENIDFRHDEKSIAAIVAEIKDKAYEIINS